MKSLTLLVALAFVGFTNAVNDGKAVGDLFPVSIIHLNDMHAR